MTIEKCLIKDKLEQGLNAEIPVEISDERIVEYPCKFCKGFEIDCSKYDSKNKLTRVLIADDEMDIAKVTSGIIKSFYPEVAVNIYTDSAQASENLSRNKGFYSALISDIRFKGQKMQGIDLIARAREWEKELPIIAYSGDEDNREEALHAGANEFMLKPFNPENFRALLNKYLINNKNKEQK